MKPNLTCPVLTKYRTGSTVKGYNAKSTIGDRNVKITYYNMLKFNLTILIYLNETKPIRF